MAYFQFELGSLTSLSSLVSLGSLVCSGSPAKIVKLVKIVNLMNVMKPVKLVNIVSLVKIETVRLSQIISWHLMCSDIKCKVYMVHVQNPQILQKSSESTDFAEKFRIHR